MVASATAVAGAVVAAVALLLLPPITLACLLALPAHNNTGREGCCRTGSVLMVMVKWLCFSLPPLLLYSSTVLLLLLSLSSVVVMMMIRGRWWWWW